MKPRPLSIFRHHVSFYHCFISKIFITRLPALSIIIYFSCLRLTLYRQILLSLPAMFIMFSHFYLSPCTCSMPCSKIDKRKTMKKKTICTMYVHLLMYAFCTMPRFVRSRAFTCFHHVRLVPPCTIVPSPSCSFPTTAIHVHAHRPLHAARSCLRCRDMIRD